MGACGERWWGGLRVAGQLATALLFTAGCSTLADSGGGSDNLPNAGAGPFRELDNTELGAGRAAPYAFRGDDDFPRDVAVLDADGEPATLETWAFVARTVFPEDKEPDARALPNEIVRHVAVDGRSFARNFEVVLVPEADWEQGTVGSPAIVRHGGGILLFYTAGGGIGLAESADGRVFVRAGDEPVLAPVDGWEAGVPPERPAVRAHPDGSLVMYYEVPLPGGSAIGLARSRDGRTWERLGDEPVLAPRQGELDAAGVGAPYAVLATSAEGRTIERLFYAATDGAGRRTIALVARYDATGPFQHANAPVFGSTGSLAPSEPVVVRHEGFTLLFVTQRAGSTQALDYPAVAVGVAPADAVLPPPDPP